MNDNDNRTCSQVAITMADIDAAHEQASKGYQSHYDYEMDLRQAFARHRIASQEKTNAAS